jgi:hypothetical protein
MTTRSRRVVRIEGISPPRDRPGPRRAGRSWHLPRRGQVPVERLTQAGLEVVVATFHDHSTDPDHDWEAGPVGLVDQGLKDVIYVLDDGGFVCVSVRPSPGGGYVVEDQGWRR